MVASHARQFDDEDARRLRHGDPHLLRDVHGRSADELRVGQPLRCDERGLQLLRFGRRQEVRALLLHFALERVGDLAIDDRGVRRRAEQAVVEALARDDVGRGLCEICRSLDVARRVARPDAICRFARGIGRAHEAESARGENHRHVAVTHELLRAGQRHGAHPADRAVGGAGVERRGRHHLGHGRDAASRRRMRTEHDRTARLDGDEDFVDRGRCRVGRRHDAGHDTERFGNLDDAHVLAARDDADGAHRPDERVDVLGRKPVLEHLVGDDAEAGFFDGHAREFFGARTHGCGHPVDDAIDLVL